ncbi:hypothetical protein OGAPHI_006949 [Ogataea philodendri]|uniref:Uncharacterized protein n=1 Tax=Ogataea philodendri TaxID=1378263 RepID=A0A9P8SZ49_9ASCO|nr:uncharacterized protein OGAPHI_006949 [Ogataea philodendri]KAH3660363.1 hypothetical protein OGAPHI_006949 [Ogataea philodendri]
MGDIFSRLAAVSDNSILFDPVSEYEISISFQPNCLKSANFIVGTRFSILDDTIFEEELRPWVWDIPQVQTKSQFVNLWPITDNLKRSAAFSEHSNGPRNVNWEWPFTRHWVNEVTRPSQNALGLWKSWYMKKHSQFHSGGGEIVPAGGIYFVNTQYFALDCQENNSLLPPLIEKHFTPTGLARYLHVTPNYKLHLVSIIPPLKTVLLTSGDFKTLLENSKHMKMVVEFNNNQVFLEDAVLQLEIKYNGLRWYLAHYPKLSSLIGILLFWTMSSFICLITTLGIFRFYETRPQIKKEDESILNLDTLLKQY